MQPTLAPAPQNLRNGPDQSADQALAQQLMPHIHPHHSVEHIRAPNGGSPPDRNIDPAISGPGMMRTSPGESGGDDNGTGSDGRKGGKRELSTSKRAAQNRQAQRAFRMRKEGHIKQLEAQVKDYNNLHENFKAVQAENYVLRDYIINLQSRLIDTQGEFPQPPANTDLPRAAGPVHQQMQAPTAALGSTTVSQLQASAVQAVADLGSKQSPQHDEIFMTNDKRTRAAESPIMHSAASQLGVSESSNRTLMA